MAIVYRHIRVDKSEPFYIGISKHNVNRPYVPHPRNKIWSNIVSKTDYEVDILFDDIDWEAAKEKEIEFIKLYGRIDLGNGTLANHTLGGDTGLYSVYLEDVIGKKYNYWTVIGKGEGIHRGLSVRVKCDCGTIKNVMWSSINKGSSKSCGCLRISSIIESNTIHGNCKSPLFHTWNNMVKNCYDERTSKYYLYGGLGITVCEKWRNDFKEFEKWAISKGWVKGNIVTRINKTLPYNEENSTVVNNLSDAFNNRTTNKLIKYKDETLTMKQICDKYDCVYTLMSSRLRNGWTIDEAIETPTMVSMRNKLAKNKTIYNGYPSF
jgi:hypothetical protein